MSLPLAADPGEAEGAELEFVAQTSEDRRFLRSQGAGQVIGALALCLKIDQVIGRGRRLELPKGLGVDARPEQRVIADVTMTLASTFGVGRSLGLGDHLGDFGQATPLGVAKLPDVRARNEPRQEIGHVADQMGVADAEFGHEGGFSQASKEAMKWMGLGNLARHNGALLTRSDTEQVDNQLGPIEWMSKL
jgi:hypothetical protein